MTRHLLFWLISICALPLVIAFIIPAQSMLEHIRSDYESAINALDTKENINNDLETYYKDRLSIIHQFISEFKSRNTDSEALKNQGGPSQLIADIPNQWSTAVNLQAYSASLRLAVVKRFAPWLLTPLISSCLVGLLERKLKNETFGAPVPHIYNTTVHLLLAIVATMIIWLLCPIPVPISILPTVGIVFCLLSGLAVSNYPKF